MAKYLDDTGLGIVWQKVKEEDATNLLASKNYADSQDNAVKSRVSALEGYFNGSGQALESVKALQDGDGATISSTYIQNVLEVRIVGTLSANDEIKAIQIQAVKLELGSEQTLAHNEGTEENPVWVLNEIPDYGEELRKCQRYYQLFRTESLRPTYGEDCRPTMATEQPTKGTLTKDGVTYYTLSSES